MPHEFVDVACQVCGSQNAEEVHTREFETRAFGRVARRLCLCSRCGFLYATPRPTPEALDTYYRRADQSRGAACCRRSGSNDRLAHRCRELVTRSVGEERAGRWLDVGCAQGELLLELDLPRWKRLGLEPYPSPAALARARGLNVIEASLEHNPLATESFDLLTCISLLEHVWDVRESMGTLERLLVRDGHLVLYVPDATRPASDPAAFFCFEHLSYFGPGSLTRLLRDFGLACVEVERTEDPGLLVCARKVGKRATLNAHVPDDRAELSAVLRGFSEGRPSKVA